MMLKLHTGNLLGLNLTNLVESEAENLSKIIKNLKSRSTDQHDWLGWLNLAEDTESFQAIQEFVNKTIESKKFDNLVVLGIGGSALGPQALAQALLSPLWNELTTEERNNALKLYFIDNVDPDWASGILNKLNLKRTLFLTITKSGGTAETISAFLWVRNALKETVGNSWKEHLVIITDPEKGPLRKFADKEKIQSFGIASNIGGRFSVFSAVGMLPLALTGIKIESFRQGLLKAHQDLVEAEIPLTENLAINLALALTEADRKLGKKINPLMPYSSHLAKISDWYVQLVAESLGKTHQIGPTPLKALGATDQHSQLQLFAEGPPDKIIFFLKVARFKEDFMVPAEIVEGFENLAGESMLRLIHAEGEGTAKALANKGVPSLTIEISQINEHTLAYLLFAFELMTAIAGDLYGIDPFDQPGVELSKKYTYALLGKKGFESYLEAIK